MRFLEEAAQLGELTVLLWPDELLGHQTGKLPQFPLVERLYFLQAVRYVSRVILFSENSEPNSLPEADGFRPRCGWMRKTRPTGREPNIADNMA